MVFLLRKNGNEKLGLNFDWTAKGDFSSTEIQILKFQKNINRYNAFSTFEIDF